MKLKTNLFSYLYKHENYVTFSFYFRISGKEYIGYICSSEIFIFSVLQIKL